MNNTSMMTADRNTHVKIVAVSLVAAILVVGVGIAARQAASETGLSSASGRVQASGPIIRAGKPMAVTSSNPNSAFR
ncbi:MAG: hypothetical protein HY659_01455 [Rhizobiales bacterium]|nr:hypothetical protein [Hyphomicrobiales bacterium]